jgi:hypothetical protein
MQAEVPQVSVLFPTLYNVYVMKPPQKYGVNLVLFVDNTCPYATERREGYVLRKIQRGLNSMTAWCQC